MSQEADNAYDDKEIKAAECKFNPDEYRDDLAGLDLTKEQQDELLQTLWHIMSAFVDMGWGVDTVQMFLPGLFENAGADSGKLLEANNRQQLNQTAAAGKGCKNE